MFSPQFSQFAQFVILRLPEKRVLPGTLGSAYASGLDIPLPDQGGKIAGAATFADDLLSSENSRQLVWEQRKK
jgi:hypothetical protein